jgi:hypothetical protein
MGLIYLPNGEKAFPDKESITAKMWERQAEKLMKPSIFQEMHMISELRRSCGVEPDPNGDDIKVRFRKYEDIG